MITAEEKPKVYYWYKTQRQTGLGLITEVKAVRLRSGEPGSRSYRKHRAIAAEEPLTEYIANSFLKRHKWMPYTMPTREDFQQEAYLAYLQAAKDYKPEKGNREAFFFKAVYNHFFKKYREANNIERRVDNGLYYLEYKQGYTEVFTEPEPDLYHKPALKQERAQEIEAERQGLEVITHQAFPENKYDDEEYSRDDVEEPDFFIKKDFNEKVFGGVSIERLFAAEEYETIYHFNERVGANTRPARMKLKTAGFIKGGVVRDAASLWPEGIEPGPRKLPEPIKIDIRDITIRPMNFKEDDGEKLHEIEGKGLSYLKEWEPFYKLVTTSRTARKFTNLDPDSELPKAMPLEYVSRDVKPKFLYKLPLSRLPLKYKIHTRGKGFKIIEYHSKTNDRTGKLDKISIRQIMKRADRIHTDLNYENRLIRDLSEFEPFNIEKGFASNYDDLSRKAREVVSTFPDQQRMLFELYYNNNDVAINTKTRQKVLFDSFSVTVHDDRKISDSEYVLSEDIKLKYTLKSIAGKLKVRYQNVLNLHNQGIKELSKHYVKERDNVVKLLNKPEPEPMEPEPVKDCQGCSICRDLYPGLDKKFYYCIKNIRIGNFQNSGSVSIV